MILQPLFCADVGLAVEFGPDQTKLNSEGLPGLYAYSIEVQHRIRVTSPRPHGEPDRLGLDLSGAEDGQIRSRRTCGSVPRADKHIVCAPTLNHNLKYAGPRLRQPALMTWRYRLDGCFS
jgi:hypothetical protein